MTPFFFPSNPDKLSGIPSQDRIGDGLGPGVLTIPTVDWQLVSAEVDHEYLARSHQRGPHYLPWQGLYQGHANHGLDHPRQPGSRRGCRDHPASYPTLKAEDIQAALQYASELVRERIVTLPGAV